MSFFAFRALNRIRTNNQLFKLNQLIDWSRISSKLQGIHKNKTNSLGGPKACNNLSMFKVILLGQWHSLSDPALEEALRVRLDFNLFTGLESQDATPDETTLCRFRNILIKKGLDEELFVEVNRQLEQLGIKIEKATGAVVDAIIISSASRPKRTLENPVQDRGEPEKDTNSLSYTLQESADPDGLLKGKNFILGTRDLSLQM